VRVHRGYGNKLPRARTLDTEQLGSNGKAFDLCSGDVLFEPRSRHHLT